MIKYYYKKDNIDIRSIMNKLVNDKIVEQENFLTSIELLEKHSFIEFDASSENDLGINDDVSFVDLYEDVVYRCNKKGGYLTSNGYILMLIGKYMDDKKSFKRLIEELEFEYI